VSGTGLPAPGALVKRCWHENGPPNLRPDGPADAPRAANIDL
jgi:hypothetical protein